MFKYQYYSANTAFNEQKYDDIKKALETSLRNQGIEDEAEEGEASSCDLRLFCIWFNAYLRKNIFVIEETKTIYQDLKDGAVSRIVSLLKEIYHVSIPYLEIIKRNY